MCYETAPVAVQFVDVPEEIWLVGVQEAMRFVGAREAMRGSWAPVRPCVSRPPQ